MLHFGTLQHTFSRRNRWPIVHSVSSEIVVAVQPDRWVAVAAVVVVAVAVHLDVVDKEVDDFVAVRLVTLTSIQSFPLVMVLVASPLNLVYLSLAQVHYCHCCSGKFPIEISQKRKQK